MKRASGVLSLAIALLLRASCPEAAEVGASLTPAAESLEGPVPAVVQRVVDGDTLEVKAAIWLGQSLIVRVRIDGVDAPEMRARYDEERRMALAARDFLTGRLKGTSVRLTRIAYDKYGGRVRASVSDGRGDIASALLSEGLVRPYHGERRQSWCAAA